MSAVRVEIRKYDGSKHRGYQAQLLGRDEHGTWLGIPKGTVGDSGKIYVNAGVILVPHLGWWTAMFNAAPQNTSVYCDITTPAVWGEGQVIVTDLDLDVRKLRQTGEVQLVDEDEFAEHQRKYGYPDEIVAQARKASSWLVQAIRDGDVEPFAGHFRRWLALVTS